MGSVFSVCEINANNISNNFIAEIKAQECSINGGYWLLNSLNEKILFCKDKKELIIACTNLYGHWCGFKLIDFID